MPVGKWKVYDATKKYLLDGTIDLDDTANWKVAFFTDLSNCNNMGITATYGTLTDELANGGGYTTGGIALTGITLTTVGPVTTWAIADTVLVASASLVFRFAVIYKNATVNGVVKPLLCVSLLDTTPADTTIPDGVTFTLKNPTGVFDISGADTN